MDLWYFFGCIGIDILKENGIETYIAQNNWITNSGASVFRNKVLKETKILNFVDFGNYKVFDTADTQTMVYVLKKTKCISNYTLKYQKLNKDNIDKNELNSFLSNNQDIVFGTKYNLNFNNSIFIDKFITFLNPKTSKLIAKIRNGNKLFLQENEMTNGIHPHHDKVNKKMLSLLPKGHIIGEGIFVINDSELKQIPKNERDLIKPFFTSNELHKYYADKTNNEWIIYTDSSFKKKNKIAKFPTIKKHLDKYVKVITSDNKPYGLHRARDNNFFIGEKIMSLRKCAGYPKFTYTDFNCYVGAMYYIIKTNNINMKYLTGILNSKLIAYWLKKQGKMQGNNYQIDKEPLMNIPIYKPTQQQENIIIDIVDKILNLTKQSNYLENIDSQNKVKEYEEQIDVMVYKLYELTYEEVLTIDKDFKLSKEEFSNFKL